MTEATATDFEPAAASPQAVAPEPRESGFKTFLVVWFGQLISLVGSNLTGFALGVWIFQRYHSVTQYSLIVLCTTLPGILLSPVAGALVDRWGRRRAMILSDLGSAVVTLAVALLLFADRLDIWMIYLAMGIGSVFGAFQWPAFAAATTQLVAKRDFGRAAGLRNLSQSAAGLIAPALAGALLVSLGIYVIVLLDFATFVFALGTLLAIRIPEPEISAEGLKARGSLWREATYGWTYVRARPGLLGLLALAAIGNLAVGMVQSLASPMVLSFASAGALGSAMSIGASGMLVGSLLMSVWRGMRRQIDGVLLFTIFCGLAIAAGGLRPSIVLFTVCSFLFFFGQAVSGTSGQAIWQVKVAPDLQGRVFAVRRLVGWSTLPLAYVIAGPLADHVFEPMLAPGGALAGSVGLLLGVGRGRGIAFLLLVTGLFLVVTTGIAYLIPRLHRVEEELPDQVAG